LTEFLVAEADETGIPMDVGFLRRHGQILEADGTPECVHKVDKFALGIRDLSRFGIGQGRGL